MTKGSIALIADLPVAGVENRTFEICTTDESLDSAESDAAIDVVLVIDTDNNGQLSAYEATEITEGQITWV